MKYDKNEDNTFQEEEIHERTYSILGGEIIETYSKENESNLEYAEIIFPDNYDGRALILTSNNDDGTVSKYEFREYK